jgi:cytochrome b
MAPQLLPVKKALTTGDADFADPVAVRVWDWPVRIVHWAMVLLLVALLTTAKIGGDAMEWHMRAGETMLALVLFRVSWGFAGSRYARFSSFVRGPRAVIAYTRSVLVPPRELHVGHNPLGGWMVIALLLALLFQAGTGLFTNDDVLTEGPLVRLITKDLSDTITGFHHRNAWIVIALATAHIGAVLFYLVALKENLIKPMLRGARTLPSTHAAPAGDGASNVRASVLFAACAAAVWLLVTLR